MMVFRPGGILPRRREGAGFQGLGISKLPEDENEVLEEGISKAFPSPNILRRLKARV
jgi:hypothetical protein